MQHLGQPKTELSQPSRIKKEITKFKKMEAPIFKGSSEPTTALNWLKEKKKTFTNINCRDQEKPTSGGRSSRAT